MIHHAYITVGDRTQALTVVRAFLQKELLCAIEGNPDCFFETVETFGIDLGRRVKAFQDTRAVAGGAKIIILVMARMTHDAQNALLKVLEEPTAGTHFFIVLPSLVGVLPTIRSRVLLLETPEVIVSTKEATSFLASSCADRMKTIEKMLKKKAGEEDRCPAFIALCSGVEQVLAQVVRTQQTPESVTALRELLQLKQYLFDTAPSLKMIGEYLALRLPQVK